MTRLFDVFLSSFALLILSPIFIPIALILKFTGEGEIFFTQERIGKNKQIFKLYKFATMLKNSANIGTGTITIKNDPRILPVGGFLRKTKINELPQLLNVFLGDMSLIGPRPLTNQTFSSYSEKIQNTIMTVRPGLSGIGSIIFRDEENIMHGKMASIDFYDSVIAPYKGSLEEWYVFHSGIYTYLSAIVVTAWVVVMPKSKIHWKVFKDLPVPPEELKKYLHYD